MSDGSIIKVEGLGKRYSLGAKQEAGRSYKTLRDTLAETAGNALRRFRSARARSASDPTEFWALRDVSFEVKQGEVIGIIGRNGAGKSTLLKILSRITEPTEGRISIAGRVASLLEVGTGFHPELTGRENIFLNGAILGMHRSEIKAKFDEIVAFAEVEKFLDTPVKRYSSGMYVRLAFAVAAHMDPEILIVDEVLAVGDAEFQKKCLGKMQQVAKTEGRTVLFVSHNMGAVHSLCSKAIYLVSGRFEYMGEASKTIAAYFATTSPDQADSLSRYRIPGYGREVRLSAIKLLCEDGENIPFNMPLRYAIEVTADIDLTELSIGSSIIDSSGHCVGCLLTEERFSIKAHETVQLNLTVQEPRLAPGRYHAGISIGRGGRSGARVDYDIVVGGAPLFRSCRYLMKTHLSQIGSQAGEALFSPPVDWNEPTQFLFALPLKEGKNRRLYE